MWGHAVPNFVDGHNAVSDAILGVDTNLPGIPGLARMLQTPRVNDAEHTRNTMFYSTHLRHNAHTYVACIGVAKVAFPWNRR